MLAMTGNGATLHMICGKIAAGKSTLSAALARESGGVVIAEDEWLHALYGDEMRTLADFVTYSRRLRGAMAPHIEALLVAGTSVVLDFQANTIASRKWMLDLVDRAGAAHVLHFLDVPDEVCLERLRRRNADGTHPFVVSEAQFHEVTKHFVAPTGEETGAIVRHTPGDVRDD